MDRHQVEIAGYVFKWITSPAAPEMLLVFPDEQSAIRAVRDMEELFRLVGALFRGPESLEE